MYRFLAGFVPASMMDDGRSKYTKLIAQVRVRMECQKRKATGGGTSYLSELVNGKVKCT
jgi:hypothetical protein